MAYDKLNCMYVAVVQGLYVIYVPLAYGIEGEPVLASNGVHQHQGMSDEPVCPGGYPMYDVMNPEKNMTIRDT